MQFKSRLLQIKAYISRKKKVKNKKEKKIAGSPITWQRKQRKKELSLMPHLGNFSLLMMKVTKFYSSNRQETSYSNNCILVFWTWRGAFCYHGSYRHNTCVFPFGRRMITSSPANGPPMVAWLLMVEHEQCVDRAQWVGTWLFWDLSYTRRLLSEIKPVKLINPFFFELDFEEGGSIILLD